MKKLFPPKILKGAEISEDGKYRYSLFRIWDKKLPTVTFIGLNPSTADAENDDPTMRREIAFAKLWGYGGLYKGNLFAFRATKPKDLKAEKFPVGDRNNEILEELISKSEIVIAAWGIHGSYKYRDMEVKTLIGKKLHYLTKNKDNTPGHTLYLKGDLKPIKWGA